MERPSQLFSLSQLEETINENSPPSSPDAILSEPSASQPKLITDVTYFKVSRSMSGAYTHTRSADYSSRPLSFYQNLEPGCWMVCKMATEIEIHPDFLMSNAHEMNERGFVTLQKKTQNRYGEELTLGTSMFELKPLTSQEVMRDQRLSTLLLPTTRTSGGNSLQCGKGSQKRTANDAWPTKNGMTPTSTQPKRGLKNSRAGSYERAISHGSLNERRAILLEALMSAKRQQSNGSSPNLNSAYFNPLAQSTIRSKVSQKYAFL